VAAEEETWGVGILEGGKVEVVGFNTWILQAVHDELLGMWG
jgi:hypothetical protein